MSARLLFRVDPVPGESPRGYLCRTAHEHRYSGPNALAEIAGLWVSGSVAGLDHDSAINPLAYALRLEPEEWRLMCYHHVKQRSRFKQRSFCGETISADDLNYRRPRLCPACVREGPIWWAVWDLGLVVACPRHRCLLINQCPACKRQIAWERPAVHKCRCGFELRKSTPEPADPDLVAINAILFRAAKSTLAETAPINVAGFCFPQELLQLKLGALLRFILFIGSIKEGNILRRKQRPFRATDLAGSIAICRGAAALLRNWPRQLLEVLRRMIPQSASPAALNFSDVFGNFYRHLFHVLPRREFGFLHNAFERFVIEDWNGLIRGQHRYFSTAVRQNAHWIAVNQAEKIAGTTGERILELVQQNQLESTVVKVRRGEGSTECWIRRESLSRWVSVRDAELARYMSRSEAIRELGLTMATLVRVAAAGTIRYVEGPEQNFPARCFFFLREDVTKIKYAFEKHAVRAIEYSRPGELIALRHAMKNYLGHGSALAAVISAVVDEKLAPAGYTDQFRGVTGYLFVARDLRRYRPVPSVKVTPEGFINYGEAAAMMAVNVRNIRGLTRAGLIHDAMEYQLGLSKLLSAAEVEHFALGYVALSALARQANISTVSLTRYLMESGTPLLSIPLWDKGAGHAYFLRKDIAAQIQIPSRRLLVENAQQRTIADRKKRWADYRLAQETATGKAMRRQLR
jgi:hypothetical protein